MLSCLSCRPDPAYPVLIFIQTCRWAQFFLILIILFVMPRDICCANEEDYLKIIQAHQKIKDFESAQTVSIKALNQYPHNKSLWIAYIKTLAKQGSEKEMLSTWKSYVEVFPEEKENRTLNEILAWGVIEKAYSSSSPTTRLMGILSAFLSQDAKGVEILCRGLNDPNSAIRAMTVQLSSHLHDHDLQMEIFRLFRREKVWAVKLETICALGNMKVHQAQEELLSLLKNPKTTAEEVVVIIESLVEMWNSITRQELAQLVRSDRAGLRLLACSIAVHFHLQDDVDLIAPLMYDNHAEVRQAALWVLGTLRISQVQEKPIVTIAEDKLRDIDPLVATKAAWLLTIHQSEKGHETFRSLLKHTDRDVRIMAASHLAACGKYAFPLILELFYSPTVASYEKMNLALGLIGQRMQVPAACDVLYRSLKEKKERWTWDETHHVRALVPSRQKYSDDSTLSPEAVDQMTRLEILNILAMMKFPHAQEAIKVFLQERTWGITATAASTLLTEGDEEAIDIVKNLLQDSNMQVKVQAALVLAMWGRGDEAVDYLQEAYAEADREMKEHILEGIIRVSSQKSIPFLLDRLQEPNQTLRVIAAAGMMMCLYH